MEKQLIIKEKEKHCIYCFKCKKTTNHRLVLEKHGFFKGIIYLKCPICGNKTIYGFFTKKSNLEIKKK